jgi:hypothetical protein
MISWGGSCTATPNPFPPGWQYNCHPNDIHQITIDRALARGVSPWEKGRWIRGTPKAWQQFCRPFRAKGILCNRVQGLTPLASDFRRFAAGLEADQPERLLRFL